MLKLLSLTAAAGLLLAQPAAAHHSFAMFDQTKEVPLSGTVVEFQWTNPHSWLELDVTNAQGQVEHWSLESGSIHTLTRLGWTSKMVKPGDKVSVMINPMKNGSKGGAMQSIVFANGKQIVGGGR